MQVMTDWAKVAAARGLILTEEEQQRAGAVLDALEAAFRPVAASIPLETEPATVFEAAEREQLPGERP